MRVEEAGNEVGGGWGRLGMRLGMRLEKLGEAGNETAWQTISQGAVASSQMSPEYNNCRYGR